MVAYATAPKPDWFWGVAPEFPTDVQNATAPFRAAALKTIGRVRPPFALAPCWPAREGDPPCLWPSALRQNKWDGNGRCAPERGRFAAAAPRRRAAWHSPAMPLPLSRRAPLRATVAYTSSVEKPFGRAQSRLQTALMAQSEGGAGLFAALSRPRQRTRRHGKLPKAVLRLFTSLPSPCLPPL